MILSFLLGYKITQKKALSQLKKGLKEVIMKKNYFIMTFLFTVPLLFVRLRKYTPLAISDRLIVFT